MKMVKSLLLGTAAGLVVVTAGQAAELPVKAKPVEYVKICTLYGAGFYYMPGTDMCLKIGGWTRAEVTDETNGNLAGTPLANNTNSRFTNNLGVRARGYITADAREQTAYGVARAYIDAGVNGTITDGGNPAGAGLTANTNRAFLQWAGFTAGLSRSFFDFYNAAVQNYRAGYLPQEDTGDAGWWVWAYTAQLGGGFSATISAEERRNTQIIQQSGFDVAPAQGSIITSSANLGYGGWQVPDVVGNIRVDQAWGSAQIMAAGHQIDPVYYGTFTTSGHPDTVWGWVAGVGAHLNTSFISPGDYIEGEFNYTQGALRYLFHGQAENLNIVTGGTEGFGIASDCVYGGMAGAGPTAGAFGTNCELTTGWSAVLSYEHYWTPQWHQSFTGAFMQVNYSDFANDMLCALQSQTNTRGIGSNVGAALPGCDNDWQQWGVGSRLQWDVTKSFYLGVEVMYNQLNSAKSADGLVPIESALGAPTLCQTVTPGCRVADQHNWAFTIRMHKDFLP